MLFGIELFVIVFGRLMGTFGLVTFLKIFGYKQEMSMKELLFVWYAGMIRGAIAFGLVLRIDGN
jgi:hypothetical protein